VRTRATSSPQRRGTLATAGEEKYSAWGVAITLSMRRSGLSLTKAQIADAKANDVQPTRTGGLGYMRGPDGALVEYAGNHPAERFNHVHMYQDDPFCAQLWYQRHLHSRVFAGRTSETPLTEATCRVARAPDRTWPALDRAGMFRAP